MRSHAGDAGQHDFKHINAAAHDGHLEATVMEAAGTQTEDLYYSLLEAGKEADLAALSTQTQAYASHNNTGDEESGLEMNPIHQAADQLHQQNGSHSHENGHATSNGNISVNGEDHSSVSGEGRGERATGRVRVLTPRVRRGSICSGYMRLDESGEEQESVAKVPLYGVDTVTRFFKL